MNSNNSLLCDRKCIFKMLDNEYKCCIYYNCINCISTVKKGELNKVILTDYNDRRPIYEQVIEKFQQMILCGALEPHSPMPSVRSLAMELSLNPNTIQRAYQELERQGYIYTQKGKGSFVSDSMKGADHKRKEVQEELDKCVSNAVMAGITEQELRNMMEISIGKIKENK